MTLSRPLVLLLLGAALLAASFGALISARARTGEEPATPLAQQSGPADPGAGAPGKASAEDAVRSAFSLSRVNSASFDVRFEARERGGDGERISAAVRGAFQSSGKTTVPNFRIGLEAGGSGQKLSAGALSTGDRGYLLSGGTAYEVPAAMWSEFAGARRQIASYDRPGEPKGSAFGVDPNAWLRRVREEGDATIAGVKTQHVSALVDTPRLINDVVKLAKGTGTTLPLPRDFERQARRLVKSATVNVYVGKRDRILRRLAVAVTLDVPRSLVKDPKDAGRLNLTLRADLSAVNRPQRIVAPAKVSKRSIRSLGASKSTLASGLLGVGVIAIDPPPGYAEAQRAGFKFTAGTLAGSPNPARVERALKARRKVVIFFHEPRGLDDQATAEGVRALKRRGGVAVFSDRIRNLDAYGTTVQDLGVSQTPSIVIIDPDRQARLIEGYIDPTALAQEVSDAR